ncbi:hypothetical protein [Planktothricoides sp. SR001]|nr:hypothetical protein [Planktothricoides sp. SR001]
MPPDCQGFTLYCADIVPILCRYFARWCDRFTANLGNSTPALRILGYKY